MTHTTFTYTCLVLAILIAIGFIIMIITIRRLHKAQKQLQKENKTDDQEKKYDWYISYSYMNNLLSKILKLSGHPIISD